jgi:hypothetical protein
VSVRVHAVRVSACRQVSVQHKFVFVHADQSVCVSVRVHAVRDCACRQVSWQHKFVFVHAGRSVCVSVRACACCQGLCVQNNVCMSVRVHAVRGWTCVYSTRVCFRCFYKIVIKCLNHKYVTDVFIKLVA